MRRGWVGLRERECRSRRRTREFSAVERYRERYGAVRVPGTSDVAIEVVRVCSTGSHGELGRREDAKVRHRGWLELSRDLAGELTIDLGDGFSNADLLVERSTCTPDIEEQRQTELIDLRGVDEDTVLVVEFVPVEVGVDVGISGILGLGPA